MQLEAHALKLMAACFNDMKDEENFKTNKKTFCAISFPVWTTTRRKGIVEK